MRTRCFHRNSDLQPGCRTGTRTFLFTLILGLSTLGAHAQSLDTAATPAADTLNWRMRHKSKRATLYSAILPGAGQIYNRKYWKAPIVWGGMGLCAYLIADNTRKYERYRDGYVALVDNDPSTVSEFEGANASSVRKVADTYHTGRDQSCIARVAVYVLNVVDATVDAHFVRFDVGDDLSLHLRPGLDLAAQRAVGLTLSVGW